MDRLRDDCAAWIWGVKPGSGNDERLECRGRGPMTKNQVAALLKDFEIRPVVVHPTKRADVSRHMMTGRRNSRTRSRVSCHPSRTFEHSSVGGEKTRKCSDVRMIALDAALRRLTVCQLTN